MSGIRTKRLITELTRLKANEDIINSVAIIDGKLDHWKVTFEDDSMSKEILKSLVVYIKFPAQYPMLPPSITINTIFHPNIYKSGKVCLSLLDERKHLPPGSDDLIDACWRASLSIFSVLLGLKSVLEEPNISSPANIDASKMFKSDPAAYIRENLRLMKIRRERILTEMEKERQEVEYQKALEADSRL